MKVNPLKALVLCAGLGTRFRPLTQYFPKPMLSFLGEPLLAHVLYKLMKSGIHEIAINTHHLSEQIQHFCNLFSSLHPKLKLKLFNEPTLLGTGGPIRRLKGWLRDEENLLVYNSDIICGVDLIEFYESFLEQNPAALMLLTDHKSSTTPVFSKNSQLLKIAGHAEAEKFTFGGIHILSPHFRRALPEVEVFSVIDTYQKLLHNSALIGTRYFQGEWFDLGNPTDFFNAEKYYLGKFSTPEGSHFLKTEFYSTSKSRYIENEEFDSTNSTITKSLVSNSASLGKNCRVGPTCVIDSNCTVSDDVCLDSVIVLPNTTIAKGVSLRNSIVYDNLVCSID